MVACERRSGLPETPRSSLATVSVGTLDVENYSKMRLSVFKISDRQKPALEVEASRGQKSLQGQVPAGAYSVQLEYLAQEEVTYTSKNCDNPAQHDLKPGLNALTIYVCDAQGQRVPVTPPEPTVNDPSTVTTTPNQDNPQSPNGTPQGTGDADLDITPVYRQNLTDKERGMRAYEQQCIMCHGEKGNGTASIPKLSIGTGGRQAFVNQTKNTMPPSNPGQCDEACAQDIAAYLFD